MNLISLMSEIISVVRDFRHTYNITTPGTLGRLISYIVFIARFTLVLVSSLQPNLIGALIPMSQILGLMSHNIK